MANTGEMTAQEKKDAKAQAGNKLNIKFPENLSDTRYIQLNFYDPGFSKSVTTALTNAINKGIQSTVDGDISVFGAIRETASTAVDVAKTIGTTFANDLQTRNEAAINRAGSTGTAQYDTTAAAVDKKLVDTIFLPLTNSLQEDVNHEWEMQTGVVSNSLNAVTNKGGTSAVNQASNAIGKITGTRSVLINPDYIQTYKGTGLRGVKLDWSLVPNNATEAENIFKIIRLLKQYSSPKKEATGILVVSPLFCEIIFKNGRLNDSVKFEEMVIENISVNYSESGFMEIYHDGAPKSIMLSVKFLERRMKTQDDWRSVESKNEGNI